MPTPKTVLIATAHSEISMVTIIACTTSGSENAAWKLASPSANAFWASVIIGQPTSRKT